MPWTCPLCQRTLSRPNAWHQCMRKPVEELFAGKPPSFYDLFLKLHEPLCRWKGVQASATKNCVVYIAEKTFLVVKPMKAALDLKFYLHKEAPDFPVYKTEQWGKRMGHYIRLFEESDLDGDVWRLLKQCYDEDMTAEID